MTDVDILQTQDDKHKRNEM